MKNENLQYSHENVAENRDFEMARYIWSILKTQLTIIMSWGIDLDSIKVVSPLFFLIFFFTFLFIISPLFYKFLFYF